MPIDFSKDSICFTCLFRDNCINISSNKSCCTYWKYGDPDEEDAGEESLK